MYQSGNNIRPLQEVSVKRGSTVGVTTECSGIPLFHTTKGDTYSMLYMAGGSTSQQGNLPTECRTLTYPTILSRQGTFEIANKQASQLPIYQKQTETVAKIVE